jgi:two-component system, sporulation sensor kinase E
MALRYIRTHWQLAKRIIRRYLERKIQRRMILNFMGLGVLPIIIVSFILIRLTENTVQSYIFDRNLEIARSAKKEIELFIEKPLTILGTIVLSRDILEMERFTQSRVINKLLQEYQIFKKIFILDRSGIAVVTTSFGEEFKDYSQEQYFNITMQADTFFSEVDFTPSRFPVMQIALPIKKYNTVDGILVGEIDLQFIWDLVDKIKIGKTGYAFLISSNGTVIAHPDKQLVLNRESFSQFAFYQELITELENINIYDYNGVEMLAAYSPISDLRWGIIVQQNEAEAFELARKMRYQVTIFVFIMALFALILAFMTIRRITKPLEVLVQGARKYAESDLTHRIRVERHDELAVLANEFNKMAESLDKNQKQLRRMERLAALSRFASLVSHEIRNPLNAMNINMQILRRLMTQADSPPEKKVKYLNIITSEINRMNNLVSNFLAIARPPELNLIRSDLHQILEEVILILEAQAKSLGIQIKRIYTKESLQGMFDHNQLKQVFHNILLNAFEAMPEGGMVKVTTINLNSKKDKNNIKPKILIKFEDIGHGIEKGKLPDIFEFYFTTKKTGTGLGLAIAKQIVEGHRGTISIKSKERVGTQVFIELPIEG